MLISKWEIPKLRLPFLPKLWTRSQQRSESFPVALPVRLTGWTDDTKHPRHPHGYKALCPKRRSPFTLGLVGGSEDAQICLSKSRRIKCASVSLDESELDTAEVIQQFVRQAFTPKVSLTQKDLSTLDGYLVEGDAEKVLDGLVNPKINHEENPVQMRFMSRSSHRLLTVNGTDRFSDFKLIPDDRQIV